jgi:Conjugal transfer protein
MNLLFWILILAFPFASNAAERVRHVAVLKDQIVQVRTAIGIATIVQVPDHPNSVVVGDQDSFKVEYLDQAITIKPLKPGAKSNLYVYTDWQRYNVQLITGHESISDFVVYLDHPAKKPDEKRTSINWHFINRSAAFGAGKCEITKAAVTADTLLVQIEITSSASLRIDPSWFWISQGKSIRPINSLVLSSLDLNPSSKVSGMIQIRRSDFSDRQPIRLEIRRKRKTLITIPQVSLWWR